MSQISVLFIIVAFLAVVIALSIVTVRQGNVAVVTIFGKFRRVMYPGLNFRIPVIEYVFKKLSYQNRSMELKFQAISQDQANVYFTAMLLYAMLDTEEKSIKNVAFKFVDERNFLQALIRSVEGAVRAFVATKRQAEILLLRQEIVAHVNEQLDKILEEWGYRLLDLQINDINFDEDILKSMSRVVVANNLKAAAENEGQALLITKTKEGTLKSVANKVCRLV